MVLRHKGLGKLAVGLAMHAVSERENPSPGKVSEEARKVGMKVASARVTDTGFSNGSVNVHVEDNLNYAALALKGGPGQVETIVQKALNSAVGYMKRRLEKRGITDALDAPFPEVKA